MNQSEIFTEALLLLARLKENKAVASDEKKDIQAMMDKIDPFAGDDDLLLLDLDEMLMKFEDFIHGEDGNKITDLRHNIFAIIY